MADVLHNLKVIGENLPERINHFTDAGFSEQMMGNLAANGYTLPTPFQKYLIPIVRESRNLVAYGEYAKHEAPGFLMPIIDKLMGKQTSEKTSPSKPFVIVIDPMRISVVETHGVATKLVQGSNLMARFAYAEYDLAEQDQKICDGCDILVATPGRILQLVEQKKIGFEKLEVLVFDQIHMTFGEGFGKDLEKLIDEMPEHQTIIFSAKLSEDVKQFAEKYMPNYVSLFNAEV